MFLPGQGRGRSLARWNSPERGKLGFPRFRHCSCDGSVLHAFAVLLISPDFDCRGLSCLAANHGVAHHHSQSEAEGEGNADLHGVRSHLCHLFFFVVFLFLASMVIHLE